jgi:hypothetical protein
MLAAAMLAILPKLALVATTIYFSMLASDSETFTVRLPVRTCAATPTLENESYSERSEGRLAMQRVDKPCTETLPKRAGHLDPRVA